MNIFNTTICEDNFCDIIDFLDLKDINSVSLVNKPSNSMTKLNRIWKQKQEKYGDFRNDEIDLKKQVIVGFKITKIKEELEKKSPLNNTIKKIIKMMDLLHSFKVDDILNKTGIIIKSIFKNIKPSKVFVRIAKEYAEQGKIKQAEEIAEKFSERYFLEKSDIFCFIAKTQINNKELEEAVKTLKKLTVQDMFLDKDATLLSIVEKYIEKGDFKKAEETKKEISSDYYKSRALKLIEKTQVKK